MRIRFPFRAAIFALIVTALAFEIATGADAQATGARRQSSASNAAAASANAPVRVRGDVMMKYLIHMVPPVYPAIAKVAHVEGTVMLHATIRQDGSVEKLTSSRSFEYPSVTVLSACPSQKRMRSSGVRFLRSALTWHSS